MHSIVARVMLAALLLAGSVVAALQLNFYLSETTRAAAEHAELAAGLGRFDSVAADLSAAQASYVAPGQPDAPWLDRSSSLQSELAATVTSFRSRAHSEDSAAQINSLGEALSRLTSADARARSHLQQEEDLLAADVVFGEARDALNNARAIASELGRSEEATFNGVRSHNEHQMLITASITAGVWMLALLVLVPRPRPRDPAISIAVEAPQPVPASPEPMPRRSERTIDLAAVADLCVALSQVVSSTALPDMLARSAALLDASGVIVWVGCGDDLCAVTSHGYDPRTIRQLGSISRSANNATAAAWRAGELQTVAGDPMSNGAIVAPMFGADGCVGVFAAEVRHGREHDPSTQAVTMMLAAQLATILATPSATPHPRAAEA